MKKALIFDLDDTIYPIRSVADEMYEELYALLRGYVSEDVYQSIKEDLLTTPFQNVADRLFGIFNTFNNNQDATGMGLYITKTEIEAMGGKIDVESQPGSGSTFFVYFPINTQ